MIKGGLRSSVITFFSGGVGAGILTLPKIMSYFGVGVGLCTIIVCSVLSYISFEILIQATFLSKKNTFGNIIKYYLGRPAASIMNYLILLTQFMICVIFFCITWDFGSTICLEYNLVDIPHSVDPKSGHRLIDLYHSRTILLRAIGLGIFTLLIQPLIL